MTVAAKANQTENESVPEHFVEILASEFAISERRCLLLSYLHGNLLIEQSRIDGVHRYSGD